MIGSLRGTLARKEASRLLVETGGVGYLVHIPFSTFYTLGEPGSAVFLLVHTHVREDAIQLFGFATELELAVFDRLIGVSGIGPRMAVTILSGIPAAEFAAAIRKGDLKRLTAVPGLGKKTSERLVVELRDKLDHVHLLEGTGSRGTAAPGGDGDRDDAVSALVNLQYRPRDAEAAVDRAQQAGAVGLEAILKAALAQLSR